MSTKEGNPSMEISFPPEEKNNNLMKKLSAWSNKWRSPGCTVPPESRFSAKTLCF